MKLCTAVQEGCGYKGTLRAHRYFAPSAKYFTVCVTYQPPLVLAYAHDYEIFYYDSSLILTVDYENKTKHLL